MHFSHAKNRTPSQIPIIKDHLMKEDSNRMFEVVKQLQSRDKNKILVNAENGVTACEKKQVQIITDHFREVFRKYSEKEILLWQEICSGSHAGFCTASWSDTLC